MTIAITGASGDIGGAFLFHRALDTPIKALVRKGTKLREPTDASIERFDFSDDFEYKQEFVKRFVDADTVFHAAGLLNDETRSSDVVDYLAINAFLTAVLVAGCNRQDATPSFIYVSSEMIYLLPKSAKLLDFGKSFLSYCEKELFTKESLSYDLRDLATKFMAEQSDFPYANFNLYVLTKYLGELIALSYNQTTILRVTNAYGPVYDNPRLIPRLIVSRLTGHPTTYVKEDRDFVYASDINKLIDKIADSKHIASVVDCKSGTMVSTKHVRDTIVHLTPTAYGKLTGTIKPATLHDYAASFVMPAQASLSDIIGEPTPFTEGLRATLKYHKEQCYHQMGDTHAMEDFLNPGERIVEVLKGSSAAYLFVVEDKESNLKVRKIAIRDGVEGNGIAKVASEISYYRHITQHEPKLAKLYPRLIDSQIDPTFSSETIEYFDGKNFYAALQDNALPYDVYKTSVQDFIDSLCNNALGEPTETTNPDDDLDSYYIERSLYRLQSIQGVIEVRDTIRINDKELPAPHIILTDLLHNRRLRPFILPHLSSFCYHGDLTFLNTVFLAKSKTIRLVDPRGHIGIWDPLYDFAKLKFTLSGFGEFVLTPESMVSEGKDGYSIDFSRVPASSSKLNDEFFSIMESSTPFADKIISKEPYWKHRISFAESTHYLADIPFRLFTDGTNDTAVASYVLGTYLLNQAYSALIEAPGHKSVQ